MKCNNCGNENTDSSLFCSKCGKKLIDKVDDNNINESNKILCVINKIKKLFSNRLKSIKYKKNIILTGIIIMILVPIIILSIYLNNPVQKYKRYIKNNEISEANKIYENKIIDNKDDVNKVRVFLKDESEHITNLFKEDKIKFNDAKERLETIRKTTLIYHEINECMDKINTINDSNASFRKAEDFDKGNDLINAMKEYNKVNVEDKNYNKARENIKNNEEKYIQLVVSKSKQYANEREYDKAISLLREADKIIPKNNIINEQSKNYEKLNEQRLEAENKQKASDAKNNQLIVVESCKIISQHTSLKILYPDMIQVIVKNKSKKTIKDMVVSCLAYDNNNYPLKIKSKFDFSGSDYELIGNADNVNIVAGAKFGQESGWELDEKHGISKSIACVKNVTFYDNTTWENPYYEYWIEQYKEKPLKQFY